MMPTMTREVPGSPPLPRPELPPISEAESAADVVYWPSGESVKRKLSPDAQDDAVPVLDFGLVSRVRQILSGGDGDGRSQAHGTLSAATAGEPADGGPAKRRRRGAGGGGAHAQMAYTGLMLVTTTIACLHRSQHQGSALPGRALKASGAAEGGGFFAAVTDVDSIASRWHQPEEPQLFLVRRRRLLV